jgi:hypothetical protein
MLSIIAVGAFSTTRKRNFRLMAGSERPNSFRIAAAGLSLLAAW